MKWIKRIIGFIKLYKDYEYDSETLRHIIETYTRIICNRTRLMSKPTYYYEDIITQMDEWYDYHDEYECGREYVSNYNKCPMCMDCPDNCPLDKE